MAYVPRVGYTTGDLDVHDIAVAADGRVIFVCTLFGCLATLSERASFQPLWRPPFLSALVPEDRCHLNGLAMRDGRAAYRHGGGRLRRGRWLARPATRRRLRRRCGLGRDRCPRSVDAPLAAVVSRSAVAGEFGHRRVRHRSIWPRDNSSRSPSVPAICAAWRSSATTRWSRSRSRGTSRFTASRSTTSLQKRGAEPQCGLQVIDLRTGTIAHWLRLDGSLVTELYDVVVAARRAAADGPGLQDQ